MDVIYVFLLYLLANYWWFLPSGPLVVEPLVDYLFSSYEKWVEQYIASPKRKRIRWGLALSGIVVASFNTFAIYAGLTAWFTRPSTAIWDTT